MILKEWLLGRFLPMWAKETVYKDNQRLQDEVKALQAENSELRAYIDGLERGMRSQRRIVIRNEVSK